MVLKSLKDGKSMNINVYYEAVIECYSAAKERTQLAKLTNEISQRQCSYTIINYILVLEAPPFIYFYFFKLL